MKKRILIILLVILGFSFNAKSMDFGFIVGLAIPSENVGRFFENSKRDLIMSDSTTTGNYLLRSATSLGYTIGVKGRIELSKYFQLVPSIALCRFNQGEYDLVIPDVGLLQDTSIGKIRVTSNVVPISLGINAHILKSFIGLYGTADLSYSYISYSYDYVVHNIGIPLKIPPTNYSRIGFGIGAGIDVDIKLLKLNFEAKFNSMNIIGRATDEPQKTYGTFAVGVFF